MHKFTIETSLPMPFYKYEASVRYNEVTKPTGVAYLLLVLLANAPKHENISKLLDSFGIPENLHTIFADEIKKLIDKKIISCKDRYVPIEFEKYYLKSFDFTDLGKKVFKEEMITSENTKTTKTRFFYDIATNQLALKTDGNLEVRKVEDAQEFNVDFFSQFECKKDREDFLNSHKTDIGIKPQEVISEIEFSNPENYFGKYPCKFVCSDNEFKVQFEHKYVQEFFDKYYTNEILNQSIKAKKKFNFNNLNLAKLSYFNDFEIEKTMFAPEFRGEIQNSFKLVLSKNKYQTNKKALTIIDENAIDTINNYIEVIAVTNEKIYGYCPVELDFTEERLGKVSIPIVLVLKIDKPKLQTAVNFYLDTQREYSFETFQKIVSICKITSDFQKAIEIMNSYMKEHSDTNISVLNQIRSIVGCNDELFEEYKKLVENNYFDYIKGVNEDSLETFLKITKDIPSLIGIENKEIVREIAKSIAEPKDKIKMFENLVQSFDAQLVLQYVNPIKEILDNGKPNSKILIDLQNFDNLLKELKKISGVKDYKKYTYQEEYLMTTKFQEVFLNLKEKDKKIELFKLCDKDYFEDCAKFMQIFSTINDSLNIIKNAQKNTQNIGKDQILKKIDLDDYQFVLVNLSMKLEMVLARKFDCEGSLFEMLEQVKEQNSIDGTTINELHDLRENRNAVVHPENRKTHFVPDDLRKWANIVFDLEKKKVEKENPKEPQQDSSNNKPKKRRKK